jgi:hypothetical protein
MKPYRLLLVSFNTPDTPDGIFFSPQMLAWGLRTEFAKLPHVTLTYQNSETPLRESVVDFALLHTYFESPIYSNANMQVLRKMTTRRIVNFMETGWEQSRSKVDYNFTFLPPQNDWSPSEQIPFPCVRELLDGNQQEKLRDSILLDHSWRIALLTSENWLWCKRLYSWLEPLSASRVIGQLRHSSQEEPTQTIPKWVRQILPSPYPSYLKQTAPYENFIMTHPGTYEHSIIDMVARGIRVLVPKCSRTGRTFARQTIVDGLGLATFSTQADLLALLANRNDEEKKIDLCMDIPEIVCRIDKYFQKELGS